ncbi:MAG: alpha/beta fold hydrolase [Myxococcota bacterium]
MTFPREALLPYGGWIPRLDRARATVGAMDDPAAVAESVRHEFVLAGGLRFHVAKCGGGDRLALLLHGFPECWYSWRHQLPVLADQGYEVWAPDLRGCGQTTVPPRLEDYAIERLMDDVAALIDAAGKREVTLIGHDWGGLIAWYFAMRRARPLARLVVLNLPHPFAAEPAYRSWKQRGKSLYALFFQIPRLPEALLRARGCRAVGDAIRRSCCHPERFPDAVLAVHRESAAHPGVLTGMLNYYRAFVIRGKGFARQKAQGAPRIETPTLMIWGERDIALSLETTRGTGRFVSDLTFRSLPDASHWVQQDDPETVNRMLRAWLSGEEVPAALEPGALRAPPP